MTDEVFTDKNLSSLKELLPLIDTYGRWLTDRKTVEALIARLEAAENALHDLNGYYVCHTYGCPNDGYDRATECTHDKRTEPAYQAWRKACGVK